MWLEKDELVVRSLRTWEALELELCKGRNLNKSNHEAGEWVHAGNSQCSHCEGHSEIQRFVSRDREFKLDASDRDAVRGPRGKTQSAAGAVVAQ